MLHLPPVFLPDGKNSTAYYCAAPPKSLVIFVHGFKGASLTTWNDFPAILSKQNSFANSDLLFYGYESLKAQAFDQAMGFFKFLKKNCNPPDLEERTAPTEYNKIVIVAHSLGAVVCRYALLEAINQDCGWRSKCKLVLFAPAHNGARLQNLVMLGIPGFYKAVGSIVMGFWPVIDDLRPESPVITRLQKETMTYQGTQEEQLLKASVLHAKGDKVVHNLPFCFDKFCEESPVPQKSHTSICKPVNNSYLSPISIVAQYL